MASDSEDDGLEELEYENEEDEEENMMNDAQDDATEEGDEDSSEEEEEEEEDDDDEEDEEDEPGSGGISMDIDMRETPPPTQHPGVSTTGPNNKSISSIPTLSTPSSQPARKRSPSPAARRRQAIRYQIGLSGPPRSFTVEAICALPHPGPVHSLASSMCMSHLLTGSDDGYIRDYDIFTALNGKTFLSAPQRHHVGVVEGLMKAGQLRFWWENPSVPAGKKKSNCTPVLDEDLGNSPVYSMAMHSDALWALGGSDTGHINLFTVRHDPGRLCHVMNGHKGPVSGLAIDYDEKSFFSAGWDGEGIQWDLNTGQGVRNFTSHGAQLAAIALRPQYSSYSDSGTPGLARKEPNGSTADTQMLVDSADTFDSQTNITSEMNPNANTQRESSTKPNSENIDIPPPTADSDTKSDVSYDPLFDGDDADESNGMDTEQVKPESQVFESMIAMPGSPNITQPMPAPPPARPTTVGPPKNAPPLLDPATYATFSPDLLLTASVDGQVILWDRRIHGSGKGAGRLWLSEKTPPWCLSACWSADGSQVYAGRRNGTVDVWDVRLLGRSGPTNTPRLLKTLRNPTSSGVVSCVVAFPDRRHIACASFDNLRLWNVAEAGENESGRPKSGVQFKIIPGHHGGYVSQMLVDPGCRFLVSASSNRGWHGESTKTVFVHDIKINI